MVHRRSNKRKIEKGEFLRDSPIGYLNKRDDGNKSDIIIDLQTAPLVRKLFDKYATGYYTIKELTKYAKEIDLKSKRGKYIVHGQIARTLQNPFYIGYMNYKGQLVPHKYETFIPKNYLKDVKNS